MVIEFLSTDLIGFLAVFGFVFALVFALMIYAKIFPESKKAVAMIAIVIGFVTALFEPAVLFMLNIIPIAAIVFVFIFFIFFVKKLFFPDKKDGKKHDVWPAILGMGVMLILINAFWDKISGYLGFATIPGDTVLWLIGILIITLIFAAAYSAWEGSEKAPGTT